MSSGDKEIEISSGDFDTEQWLAENDTLPYRDEDILRSYIADGYTPKEIAETVKVHPDTIRRWLHEFEIDWKDDA